MSKGESEKGCERQLEGKRLPLAGRRGCVYLCGHSIFPSPSVYKYSKGARLWIFNPLASSCILRPCWVLGEVQTQLKIHICSICSALPSPFGSRREHRQYGGKQTQEALLPLLWPPRLLGADFLLPWVLRLIRPISPQVSLP